MNGSSRYLVCEGREIHYTEWGAGNRQTVIAWHGLARTGRRYACAAKARICCCPRSPRRCARAARAPSW